MSGPTAFQVRTAENVIRRFWHDRDRVSRFLVADEVGLGKTIVAKRILEEALARAGSRNADVVYLCSSQPVASQNLKRLKVHGHGGTTRATRLTLLALQKRTKGVRYLALTPTTSFNVAASSGNVTERALIFLSLRKHFPRAGLQRILQQVSLPSWRSELAGLDWQKPERSVTRAFARRVLADANLSDDLRKAIKASARGPQPGEEKAFRRARNELVGRLRKELAVCGAATLAADGLVIVDEFQKFSHLLDARKADADQAVRLAATLLGESQHDRRVLLLSATPYRLPGRAADPSEKPYDDFVGLMRFLAGDAEAEHLAQALGDFEGALSAVPPDEPAVLAARDRAQNLLRRVMSRTERTGGKQAHDAMVTEDVRVLEARPADLAGALATRRLSRLLGTHDGLEYWKSAPYFLEFMRNYRFRTAAVAATDANARQVAKEANAGALLLDRGAVRRMEPLADCSAKTRNLIETALPKGSERLLWVPPSLPYLEPMGAFASAPATLKHLVFTEWRVAPDAITAMVSYEAERRLAADLRASRSRRRRQTSRATGQNHATFGKLGDLLRLGRTQRGRHDPTAGMAPLALLIPSSTLADAGDPLELAMGSGARIGRVEALAIVRSRLSDAVRKLPAGTGRPDERWYWAAPLLLDERRTVEAWLRDLAADGESAGPLAAMRGVLDDREALGRKPRDLVDVLSRLAIGGPGVCAYRAFRRSMGEEPTPAQFQTAAFMVGRGFQSLFNQGDAVAAVQLEHPVRKLPYWRQVVEYCIDGNLQAILDEQAHLDAEALAQFEGTRAAKLKQAAKELQSALAIRSASIEVNGLGRRRRRGGDTDSLRLRCRHSLRFAEIKNEDGAVSRLDAVRGAFNSPFRPFVLASTAVGQEGLDFHPWCHAVVHWNLPRSPVELEQREGRVHRYKGHAVRRNVAAATGWAALASTGAKAADPWDAMFAAAADAPGDDPLSPCWVFEATPSPTRIRRIVPMLACSREHEDWPRLRDRLATYRLVMGMPRQEDILSRLERNGITTEQARAWRIELSPPPSTPIR